MTGEAKQALTLALAEARTLHHDYIGTEHLLLGLLAAAERTPRGDFTSGTDPAQARQRVLDELRRAPL
jgi:ATP-dependent Clp protease ATP-binding subunit ClpA